MQYDYGTEDNEVNHIYSENERQKERENECAGPCLYLAPPADVCIFFFVPIRSLTKGRWKRKEEKESKEGPLRLSFAAVASGHHTQHKTPCGRRQ